MRGSLYLLALTLWAGVLWSAAAEKPPPAGPATAAPAPTNSLTALNSMEALDDTHRLGIGDRLSFRIIEDQEDPKPLVVTDSGELEVPYLGRVDAANKTCKELAYQLKAKFEEEYYYHATVILAVDLLNRSRGKVYLVGYVRMPGPQDIPSDEVFTLSKAIMRAGGFNDFADKKKVRVTRKGPDGTESKPTIVDVAAILEDGQSERDLKLESGDLIYVPSRLFKF